MNLKLSAIGVFVAAALCAGASQASTDYTFTTLAAMGSNDIARAINDNGQVAGYFHLAGGGYHAALWSGGSGTDLTAGPDRIGAAYGINNAGQVVGSSGSGDVWGAQSATLWSGGVRTVLNPGESMARGINDAGVVVGSAGSSGSDKERALMWNAGVPTELDSLNGRSGSALAINNAGTIVGHAGYGDLIYSYSATRWNGTAIAALDGPAGPSSIAFAVNSAGVAVGENLGAGKALLWQGGASARYLGTLGGGYSSAYGINDAGLVVGESTLGGWRGALHATLWRDGEVIDLNNYMDAASVAEGWVMTSASDINNKGWIVGNATNTISGSKRAFMLSVSAVPEPETYAMLLAGLGLMGFVARRRRRA